MWAFFLESECRTMRPVPLALSTRPNPAPLLIPPEPSGGLRSRHSLPAQLFELVQRNLFEEARRHARQAPVIQAAM